jgi:hypothetical protein
MRRRIARRLHSLAGRLDPTFDFRREPDRGGWVLNHDGRGLPLWYRHPEYMRAYLDPRRDGAVQMRLDPMTVAACADILDGYRTANGAPREGFAAAADLLRQHGAGAARPRVRGDELECPVRVVGPPSYTCFRPTPCDVQGH